MSEDYIEWDGTEKNLEHLLLWWGTRIHWEHSPDCDQDPRNLHCCEGVTEFESKNSIESAHFWREPYPLTFGNADGTKTDMELGDRIYYRGEGLFELVKKNA